MPRLCFQFLEAHLTHCVVVLHQPQHGANTSHHRNSCCVCPGASSSSASRWDAESWPPRERDLVSPLHDPAPGSSVLCSTTFIQFQAQPRAIHHTTPVTCLHEPAGNHREKDAATIQIQHTGEVCHVFDCRCEVVNAKMDPRWAVRNSRGGARDRRANSTGCAEAPRGV